MPSLSPTFKRALAVASASTQTQQHGALVIAGKGAIGVGINVARAFHHSSRGWSTHAEVAAIEAAKRVRGSLRGCTLVSARVKAGQRPALSRPCGACWAAMIEAGISRVIYHDGEKIVSERVA